VIPTAEGLRTVDFSSRFVVNDGTHVRPAAHTRNSSNNISLTKGAADDASNSGLQFLTAALRSSYCLGIRELHVFLDRSAIPSSGKKLCSNLPTVIYRTNNRFPMSRKLSVLTWNVWFDQLSRTKRYQEILDVCDALRPDIVCFQEVTLVFMDIYSKHKLGDVYDNSRTCWGEGRFPYGVVSLCKKELQPRLISDMNRNLLTTCVDGPLGEVCIGNVHLESLDSPEFRARQLKTCRVALEGRALSVLCGDFNICSYRNYHEGSRPLEQLSIDNNLGYRDAWVDVHQQSGVTDANKGYTFDTDRNEMLGDHRPERMRYDRIMYCERSPDGAAPWRPVSIEIVGDRPVGENVAAVVGQVTSAAPATVPTNAGFSTPPKKEPQVFPSDHFGLYAVFEL
jgi:endonuclease/exonuclease/phosphatase family metal-dependent hydrolase